MSASFMIIATRMQVCSRCCRYYVYYLSVSSVTVCSARAPTSCRPTPKWPSEGYFGYSTT